MLYHSNISHLIMGIGNPILTDDAVGLLLIEHLRSIFQDIPAINLTFKRNYSAGIDLLEELSGYQRVMLIDSIVSPDHSPGTCLEFKLEDLKDIYDGLFIASHGLNLTALWQLGHKLGILLPAECRIIGIVINERLQFGEKLSAGLEAVFGAITSCVSDKIIDWIGSRGDSADICNTSFNKEIRYGC